MGLADYEGPHVKSQRIPVTATRLLMVRRRKRLSYKTAFFIMSTHFWAIRVNLQPHKIDCTMPIDLRSDTVTRPTPAMLDAIPAGNAK